MLERKGDPNLKLNALETHDRLQFFLNREYNFAENVQTQIDQRPFGDYPFYVFCHPRTHEDGSSKRYIWSPWIWKPRAQTNSLLIKAYPGSDMLKLCWILPVREMWDAYKKGTIFENPFILECINQFQKDKSLLEQPEEDDPSAERAQEIAFEYQPQLFKRESLPEHLKPIWDRKIAERKRLKQESVEDSSSSVLM